MIPRLAAFACVAVACGRDVRLGTTIDASFVDVSADAPVDSTGNSNPFMPGTYAIQFLDPGVPSCTGTLSGSEADFDTVTRASISLVDGTVALSTPNATTLAITGPPIASGWGQNEIDPVADAPGAPPAIWEVVTDAAPGSGPDDTVRAVNAMGVDSTTASAPGGIEGESGAAFSNLDSSGTCTVSFGALLTAQ